MLSKTHRTLVEGFIVHDCPLVLGKLNDCLAEIKQTISWNRWTTENKTALIKAADAYVEELKNAEAAHANALQCSIDDVAFFSHLRDFVGEVRDSVIPQLNETYLRYQAYCEEIQKPNQLMLYLSSLRKAVDYFRIRWESVSAALHGRVVREWDDGMHPSLNDISLSRTIRIAATNTATGDAPTPSNAVITVDLRIHMRLRIHYMMFRVQTPDASTDAGIKDAIDEALKAARHPDQRAWLTTLANSLQDEDDSRPVLRSIATYLLDTCEMVLRDNPSILRQSRVAIDITVNQTRDDMIMEYSLARSSPGQVFILVNGVNAVGEYISYTGVPAKETEMYQSFLHELMHAKDPELNKPYYDPKLVHALPDPAMQNRRTKELQQLVPGVSQQETVALFNVLFAIRNEGLARLGELLGFEREGMILFTAQKILPNLQAVLCLAQEFIDGKGPAKASTNVVSADPVQNFAKYHLEYSFGLFCAFLIAADSMRKSIDLFKTPRGRAGDEYEDHGSIRSRSVGKYLLDTRFDVGVQISAEGREQFRQAINRISMMSIREFFHAFFIACDRFGLGGLFRIHYRKLDDVAREQQALLIACGFRKEAFGKLRYEFRTLRARLVRGEAPRA